MRGIGNFVELFWREGKVSRIPSSLYSNFTDSSINSPSFSALLLIILLLCLLVWFVVCENTSDSSFKVIATDRRAKASVLITQDSKMYHHFVCK